MGREHKKRRSMRIKQAQKRHAKLAKLRKKYLSVKNESEKDLVWEKVLKIAPWLIREEFLVNITKSEKPAEENKESQ